VAEKLAKGELARAAYRLAAGSRLPALILLTDDARLADPLSAARALPRGSLVIVRSRDAVRRRKLFFALKPIARLRRLMILVADDPALARYADGIHLPQVRAPQAAHWRALRPKWIVTVAAHAPSTRARHADAVLLSPVFPTASHPGAISIGAARARMIAQASPIPIYALGGIDAANAKSLHGFIGIAAISALA
jgi:thiamine-phosphate pyrophosphorylase